MNLNKGGSIANKQSINLVDSDKKKINPLKVFIAVLAISVVGLAVAKFGIIDRYELVDQARSEYENQEDIYNSLLVANKDYDDVVIEYNRYSFGAMTDAEKAVADRGDVLDLIEKYLIPAAQIENVYISGNNIQVNMSGIDLKEASELIDKLLKDDLVSNVTVSTASSSESMAEGDEKSASIALNITLQDNNMSADTTEEVTEQ